MDYNTNWRVTLTTCPNCGAICFPGHDDDWQAFCSSCEKHFSISSLKDFSRKEYDNLVANSKRVEVSGWVSYQPLENHSNK